jgi:hypothetical protein
VTASTSPGERTWSARAAWKAAGVPDRVCRRAVDKGFVPAKALRGEHLLALRVVAASEQFPAGPHPPRTDLVEERTRVACRAVADCWYQGDDSWVLLLTPLDARIARDERLTMALLDGYRGQQVLLLPVGRWAGELRQVGRP